MRIKKGDNIIVISGKDRGKTGQVVKAMPKDGKVVVDGVNIRKRHQRPKKQGQKGQIVELAAPINVSNIALIDPKTKKPTRVGSKTEGGKKVRVSKKTGTVV